jgi:hypothetical protein
VSTHELSVYELLDVCTPQMLSEYSVWEMEPPEHLVYLKLARVPSQSCVGVHTFSGAQEYTSPEAWWQLSELMYILNIVVVFISIRLYLAAFHG